tara:strand:+ start:1605 stop:2408 length:804 start_codon:yes stop_codon:yes gene_type:complete
MVDVVNEKFEHRKSLGQHFLNSDHVPKKMCDAGAVGAGDTVLEIGPGTGALTKELLIRGAQVVAVEADERAISTLKENFAEEIAREQLVIHHQDARELFPSELGLEARKYKVVANIPYYISGLLLRQLLDTDYQPNTLVFLIQKELAERIARDQKESLLSLSVKIFGDPSYICTVKRGHFTPPPKVDSAILAINNISQDRLKDLDSQRFFELLHLGFGQKRKQLLSNLTAIKNREELETAFKAADLPLNVRAEDVPLKEWLKLVAQL